MEIAMEPQETYVITHRNRTADQKLGWWQTTVIYIQWTNSVEAYFQHLAMLLRPAFFEIGFYRLYRPWRWLYFTAHESPKYGRHAASPVR